MPAIEEKRKVLNGKVWLAFGLTGGAAGSFFYREKVEGKEIYRLKCLTTLQNNYINELQWFIKKLKY